MRDGTYEYLGFLERAYLRAPGKTGYETAPLNGVQKEVLKRAPLPAEILVDATFGRLNGDPQRYKQAILENPELKYSPWFFPPERALASMVTHKPISLGIEFQIRMKRYARHTVKMEAVFLNSDSIVTTLRNQGEVITIEVPKSMDNQFSLDSKHALTVYAKKAGHYVYGYKRAPKFSVFGS